MQNFNLKNPWNWFILFHEIFLNGTFLNFRAYCVLVLPGTNSLAEALNELPLWVEATSSPEAAASSSTILLGTNSRAFTSREEVEVDLVEVVVGSSS